MNNLPFDQKCATSLMCYNFTKTAVLDCSSPPVTYYIFLSCLSCISSTWRGALSGSWLVWAQSSSSCSCWCPVASSFLIQAVPTARGQNESSCRFRVTKHTQKDKYVHRDIRIYTNSRYENLTRWESSIYKVKVLYVCLVL